jgi:hypothetical protein
MVRMVQPRGRPRLTRHESTAIPDRDAPEIYNESTAIPDRDTREIYNESTVVRSEIAEIYNGSPTWVTVAVIGTVKERPPAWIRSRLV